MIFVPHTSRAASPYKSAALDFCKSATHALPSCRSCLHIIRAHMNPQSPQSHISQAIHCSPCLADLHAPRIPIRAMFPYVSADPPYNPTAPKNPIPISTRPAFRSPHIPNQPAANHPTYVRTCTAMARAIPPRPAAGSRGSTHPTCLLKFPAPTRGAWTTTTPASL